MTRVLSADVVASALEPAALVDRVGAAFQAVADGVIAAPPRLVAQQAQGRLGVLLAAGPGFGAMVKTYSVGVRPDRPTVQATVSLYDDDGQLVALLDGGALTAARTAAVSALAAQRLAPPGPLRLAVLGSGRQARLHARFFHALFEVESTVVWSDRLDEARALARDFPAVQVIAEVEHAVARANVVLCCTSAGRPVLHAVDVRPGTHVSSIGAMPPAGELDPELLRAHRVFVDTPATAGPPPHGAPEFRELAGLRVTELSELVSGRSDGRRDAADITVFKSTGHGAVDLAAAWQAFEYARERDLGHGLGLDTDA